MYDFTRIAGNIKEKISNYSKKVTKNIKKPTQKFITQMMYGMLESKTVLLSEIARTLKEETLLKKTIERLSRNLSNLAEEKTLYQNYIEEIKGMIDESTVFCVDESDISKRRSKQLELLGRVRDGSTGETNVKGYMTIDIAAITKEQEMPVSVYSHIFSNVEERFESANEETLKGLRKCKELFGTKGIYALDRGYDNNIFFEYFVKSKNKFVIRCKNNRNVIWKNTEINILELTNKINKNLEITYKNKRNKTKKIKLGYEEIKLPFNPQYTFNLIVVEGFGKQPMMLLTNVENITNEVLKSLVEVYIKRWKIEEYFRFKKQQFDFENLRVRKLKAMRNMNLILTILIGFIAILSEKNKKDIFFKTLMHQSRRIVEKAKLDYYSIADGICNVFKKAKTGITPKHLSKNAIHGQISLFNLRNLRHCGIW
ncbi:MAG TPA: transposase [Methanosarcina sp.]|jgi:hypothetical protein